MEIYNQRIAEIITKAENEGSKLSGKTTVPKYLSGMLQVVTTLTFAYVHEHCSLEKDKVITELKQSNTNYAQEVGELREEVKVLKEGKIKQDEEVKVLKEDKIKQDKLITDLKTENKELQEQTDASNQYNRRDNLKLTGIPFVQGENLVEIAKSVTKHIGNEISEQDISDIHRLPTQNTTSGGSNVPGIIIRVNRRTAKYGVMDKKKHLRSYPHPDYPNLGIYEDLTPLRSRILYALRNRTKEGVKEFKFTWSKNGRIFCRTEAQTKPGPDRKLPRPGVVNKPNDLLKLGFSEQEVQEIVNGKRK